MTYKQASLQFNLYYILFLIDDAVNFLSYVLTIRVIKKIIIIIYFIASCFIIQITSIIYLIYLHKVFK
jgi:hypothetical protein